MSQNDGFEVFSSENREIAIRPENKEILNFILSSYFSKEEILVNDKFF